MVARRKVNSQTGAIPGGDTASFAEFSEAIKKKPNAQVEKQSREAANLEDAALLQASPLYDNLLVTLASLVDHHGLTPPPAAASVAIDLDPMQELLADALLASYLLGLAHVRDTTVDRQLSTIAFADPVETAFNVPPKEAIEYFQKKKMLRKAAFNKLAKEAKSGAFTVGGVYKEDVMKGFKQELHTALDQGRTQAQTIKRFHEILSGAGHKQLGEFHLETVFRTNMQTAYGVGRRFALEEVKGDLPFWTRHAVMDDRTRPTHAALDGITLPADDEFWNTHFCPDDFNCRCSVTAASSMPDGYSPRNPSGLTDEHGEPLVDISYDAAGLPAKAEIGTTVYDLQAGSFNGIPKGATLLSAIEAGANAGRQ